MLIKPEDLIGETLKGTYEIDRYIDKGGMGFVYHARKQNSSHEFAIKVLPPKEALSDVTTSLYQEFFARFHREATTVAHLRHPHIVSVYDIDLHDGMAYLVMPYLRGGTLQQKLRTNGPLSPHEALAYIRQIAEAIDFIHLRGIVHRDIKPLNIMFDDQGQLVLMDFGIAHIFGSTLTKIGIGLGTRGYVSPEAERGEAAHHRDDIYSLGVVLYVMLTSNNPAMVHRPNPSIPSEVAAVIRKATAARREDRYASAGAMAEALRIAVGKIHNAPTVVVPPVPIRRAPPPVVSRFLLMSIGIVGVFIIGASIVISFLVGSSQTTVEQARATVNQYYLYWNARNYAATYDLLSSKYQKEYPYTTLLPAYQQTHHSCAMIDNALLQSDGSVEVQVTDNAVEDLPSGGGTVVNVYKLTFKVQQERGQWKVTPHDLQRKPIQGVCESS